MVDSCIHFGYSKILETDNFLIRFQMFILGEAWFVFGVVVWGAECTSCIVGDVHMCGGFVCVCVFMYVYMSRCQSGY